MGSSERAPYGSAELLPLAHARAPAVADPGNEAAQLWARQAQGDAQAREQLIMLHLSYAKGVAAKLYGAHYLREVPFEDYLQWATVGMIESLDRYDPARGALFTTFAHPRILGAIRDGLAHISDRQEQAALRKRLLTERMSAAKEGVSLVGPEPIVHAMMDISMSLILGFMLDGTGMIQDEQASLPNNAYEQLAFKQERARVHAMLECLTDRERSVIKLHYLQGLTYELIAQTLGISKPRVCQLHAQALQRLRAQFHPT